MSPEDRVYYWLAGRGPQPIYQDDIEVPLPQGFYICRNCKQVTHYWKPGELCSQCEYESEFRFEQERGN